MPTFTLVASSTFTGANENPLSEGGVWATGTAETAFQRLSNAAQPSDVNNGASANYIGIASPNDQYSRANLTVSGTAGAHGIGLRVRGSESAQTFYMFVIDHAASNNATIYRCVTSSFTSLAAWTQAFSDGDQFTLAIEGQKLYVYDKTLTEVKNFDDAGGGGPTTGDFGIQYSSVETSASIDNWEGGSFSSAAGGAFPGLLSIPLTLVIV